MVDYLVAMQVAPVGAISLVSLVVRQAAQVAVVDWVAIMAEMDLVATQVAMADLEAVQVAQAVAVDFVAMQMVPVVVTDCVKFQTKTTNSPCLREYVKYPSKTPRVVGNIPSIRACRFYWLEAEMQVVE